MFKQCLCILHTHTVHTMCILLIVRLHCSLWKLNTTSSTYKDAINYNTIVWKKYNFNQACSPHKRWCHHINKTFLLSPLAYDQWAVIQSLVWLPWVSNRISLSGYPCHYLGCVYHYVNWCKTTLEFVILLCALYNSNTNFNIFMKPAVRYCHFLSNLFC